MTHFVIAPKRPAPPTRLRAVLAPLAMSMTAAAGHGPALAQSAPAPVDSAASAAPTAPVELPVVRVQGERSAAPGYAAPKASVSTMKSDVPLFETPQSVTVVTRELMDARNVQTLNDALQSVAGVVTANFGRRGWDDFIIRGQRASESVYLDGLRVEQNNHVSQETFGLERLEVLKGPASMSFGLAQPGGIVNMVSKRPRPDAFGELGFAVGSYGLRQATVDVGRPIDATGAAAFRVNALAMDKDDPTDEVWFKNRWIAPSLTLDLGPDTDLTILTSYNSRQYMRQQGLPPVGSVLPNPNGPIDRDTYIGDPSFGHYDAEQGRVGYALEHRARSGWTFRQNFRYLEHDMDGRALFAGALGADGRTLARTGSIQDWRVRSIALDNQAQRQFATGGVQHTLLLGLDANNDRFRQTQWTCPASTVPTIDVDEPVYGADIGCPDTPNTDVTTTVSFVGLYLRDQMKIGEKLRLSAGLRHDRSRVAVYDHADREKTSVDDKATTGSVGLLYTLTPGVAPYASYATSFLPVSGVDAAGNSLEPERGRQGELGLKLQSADGRMQGSVAAFELMRRNVVYTEAANPGINVQAGKQRSQGVEAELAADLREGWSFSGAYAYTRTKVVEDREINVGLPLNNVPRHSLSLWTTKLLRGGPLPGLSLSAGLRHESEKDGFSFTAYTVPSYTVADLGVGYLGVGWRVNFTVKNLFDRDTYAGGLSNNVVALGDPRTAVLSVVYEL